MNRQGIWSPCLFSSVTMDIDLAKAYMDVLVLAQGDAQRLNNDAEGHSAQAASLRPLGVTLLSHRLLACSPMPGLAVLLPMHPSTPMTTQMGLQHRRFTSL